MPKAEFKTKKRNIEETEDFCYLQEKQTINITVYDTYKHISLSRLRKGQECLFSLLIILFNALYPQSGTSGPHLIRELQFGHSLSRATEPQPWTLLYKCWLKHVVNSKTAKSNPSANHLTTGVHIHTLGQHECWWGAFLSIDYVVMADAIFMGIDSFIREYYAEGITVFQTRRPEAKCWIIKTVFSWRLVSTESLLNLFNLKVVFGFACIYSIGQQPLVSMETTSRRCYLTINFLFPSNAPASYFLLAVTPSFTVSCVIPHSLWKPQHTWARPDKREDCSTCA